MTRPAPRSGCARRLVRALALACGALLAASPALALPSFAEVRRDFAPSDTVVLDRAGEPIHRLRTDAGARRGRWTALEDMSPALRTAIVQSEDKRFHEHSGVDWRAVSAAAWGNLWNTRTRGASTLTMQLAGLLDDDLRRGAGGRDLTQKIGQAVAARRIEAGWRKTEILEAYLNLVPFRGELVGIDALSRTLFGKAPHGLDDREAAVAAALVRAPNARPAQVAQRACGVLRLMQPGVAVDCLGLDVYAGAALQRRAFEASEGVAPHAARAALREAGRDATPQAATGAASVRTTLRASLQRFAVGTLDRQLRELAGRQVEDGAIVVLDNASGQVLAWVGSSGRLSRAAEVDGVMALRQAGSTLKPFLYAQAIAERRLTSASLLEDSPAHIPTAGGLYIPQNYDRQFKNWVSVRTALAASLNVPAVRTLGMVSPDAFHRQLKAAGLPLRETGDYYGFSLALGSAEVSLLSLANAYRALANGGRYTPVAPLRVAAPAAGRAARAVFDPAAAFVVADILSDSQARSRTFGTGSVLATRFWSAVKTGTSKDMRDNWAVGWSERYTVAVWIGNASGAPMHEVSGSTGAAPVWAAVMGFLHAHEPSRAPTAPPGLRHLAVRFGPGSDGLPLEAARDEWFVAGTEQARFVAARGTGGDDDEADPRAAGTPRIVAPATGTVVALDPDIPPQRQRLAFAAHGRDLVWRMDGREFARGNRAQWLPWPGRHKVELVDTRGRVLDEIRIEVRGAGVKGAPTR